MHRILFAALAAVPSSRRFTRSKTASLAGSGIFVPVRRVTCSSLTAT
jgi:hypothetical protein